MITVTPEEITQFRSQFADNPEALAALDAIAECNGSVEDAIPIVFMGESVLEADINLKDWLEKCRQFICQEEVRDALESGLIAPVVEPLAMSTGIPAGTATALSILVFKLGAKKFCHTPESGV
ncbi:hypothetical protein [Calothrix sp. PCC 6303]|uniref:hypothetical protein n=1 Tax=Calothrix sp. PCC 6303 TaxID=1170562 RepID=UPI0002A03AED|nr:hypothetical protein [Calothrix sp. PCC 6303]AFZ01305.1 hypothetical protein Cal6303_2289 [Calothrix sp. PCC 6303]